MDTKKYCGKGAALFVALASCATPYNGDGTPRMVSNPNSVTQSNKAHVGADLVRLLGDEFDNVRYEFFLHGNHGGREELIITGSNKDGENRYWDEWGVNIDHAYDVWSVGRPVLEYLLGRDVYVKNDIGDTFSSPSFNHNTAKILANVIDLYIRSHERDPEFQIFKERTTGALGPVGAYKK